MPQTRVLQVGFCYRVSQVVEIGHRVLHVAQPVPAWAEHRQKTNLPLATSG
jgi:hypothetical protein